MAKKSQHILTDMRAMAIGDTMTFPIKMLKNPNGRRLGGQNHRKWLNNPKSWLENPNKSLFFCLILKTTIG